MYAYVYGHKHIRACVCACVLSCVAFNTINMEIQYTFMMDLDEFNVTREKSINSRVKIRRSISLA